MKRNKFSSMLLVGIAMLCVVSTFAQDKFSDANVEYEFVLPEKEWKMTVKPSEYSPNVEYVYKDRRDGHLQVRKIVVEADSLFSEMIREEEQKLQFVPGYVAGKEENFKGALNGRVFNYEFIRSGRNMSGRFYFLRSGLTTVYIVRFTGRKDKLRSIRNQTDYIARTFTLKETKGNK